MTATSNVMRFLQCRARENPNHLALKFENQSLTYAEVEARTDKLARAFRDAGVAKGDSVCLMLPNGPEFVLTWFAVARVGAVTVPINTEYKEDRVAKLLNAVDAKVVVSDARFGSSLERALDQVHTVHTVIEAGSSSDTPGSDSYRRIRFEDFHPTSDDPAVLAVVEPGDAFMLVFTSGSTGEAKAVEISHGYAEHFTTELATHVGYSGDDVLFTCFPLFHTDAALLTVLPAIILGGTAAIVERFSASRFWGQVRRLEATAFTAMGAVQGILLSREPQPEERTHHVRVAVAGAVHSQIRAFEQRFGIRIAQVYGATEFGLVAFNPEGPAEPGILGRPCEHHEVIVADENDLPVPGGSVGQVLVRPRVPQACMTGYRGDGQETAKAWRNLWYHTGDLAYADETGLLHFVGRSKDVIRRRGRNIPPAEIETALRDIPGISECAAIAVPSELIEDEVKVVLEKREGAEPNVEDIIAIARERLPRYMQPRYIEIVNEIPRTATQKLDKVALRTNWRTETTVDVDLVPRNEDLQPQL